jgi:hypothetical protein
VSALAPLCRSTIVWGTLGRVVHVFESCLGLLGIVFDEIG